MSLKTYSDNLFSWGYALCIYISLVSLNVQFCFRHIGRIALLVRSDTYHLRGSTYKQPEHCDDVMTGKGEGNPPVSIVLPRQSPVMQWAWTNCLRITGVAGDYRRQHAHATSLQWRYMYTQRHHKCTRQRVCFQLNVYFTWYVLSDANL